MQKAVAFQAVAPTCVVKSQNIQKAVIRQRPFTAGPTAAKLLNSRHINAERANVIVASSSVDSKTEDSFIPVMRPEDLPKGVRKEVRVNGKSILVFWYRNQIYAIEARSPAEGAYSEGFIRAKFTQDFCIECPSTGTTFSLKDGSIVSWYPNNPVLRMLTPIDTCRPLEIYPVKLSQDAIAIDVTGSAVMGGNVTKGGSDTSLENNNVYGLEPKVYVEDGAEAGDAAPVVAGAATAVVAVLAGTGVIASFYAIFLLLTN